MIRICDIKDKNNILDYINGYYYKSLYLYLNFVKYGFSNKNIDTYLQFIDNNIVCVLLSFGKTLHVLSRNDNADILELSSFIKENDFSVVCTNGYIASKLYDYLDTDKFELSLGSILELKSINSDVKNDNKFAVEKANDNDFDDLVDFLISDDDKKKVYSKESLLDQIVTRNKESYGRNYIIKDNCKIVAHAGTGAENENIAVINSVLVDKTYRGKGIATFLVKKLCLDLLYENKICYLMVLEEWVKNIYNKIGFYEVETYGKLIKK